MASAAVDVLAESQAEARALREQLEQAKLELQQALALRGNDLRPPTREQTGSSRSRAEREPVAGTAGSDAFGIPQSIAWGTWAASTRSTPTAVLQAGGL
mmetsp:Transcript_51884/g.116488  ORF Transcript_51884/g.116488 Transcript_51884/m.116488 type:complete len:99 (+) Transcript_51884:129-425(+)